MNVPPGLSLDDGLSQQGVQELFADILYDSKHSDVQQEYSENVEDAEHSSDCSDSTDHHSLTPPPEFPHQTVQLCKQR